MLKNTLVSDKLISLADEEYKNFHSKLIPGISEEKILGVRIPAIRKLAKELKAQEISVKFIDSLPHYYYEENNLHAFLIEQITDIDSALEETEKFLPYIDNWATCDSFFPKIFKKHTDILEKKALKWIKSEHCYIVRYGIGIFMRMFLDEHFDMKYPRLISEIKSDEYYVNMMIAWYFTTALSKRYDECLRFIKEKKLDKWIHNKIISKCNDSFRITAEQKSYLKSLRLL